ncbi:L-threonine 3-dehydrogenase [hydrothermal vent metagenome]|uniref:L-threonine 3-dehydrogenase n=1 Tax=hydrothermal vent metagenome TaxID=652676 RepID=A0A3B0TR47_9ZZZZ
MKALVKSYPERGIWLQEVDMPKPGPNDALIKIQKSAVCGTDLHIYKWDEWAQQTIKTPVTIGHEYMGIVVETGEEVDRVHVGERVTVEGHIACGFCRNCRRGRQHICDHTVGIGVNRDGGFAEYISVPAKNVLHIDQAIPDEIMAIMDPLGNATHTALSFPILGEDVLITGAGGPIGAMATAICKFSGARYIVGTDLSKYRCALARKMGATKIIDPTKESIEEAMHELGMVGGFDIGLECSGSPIAFNDMVNNMYNGGKISLLGLLPKSTQISWNKLIFKGLTLKGIYGREMYDTWYHMEMMLLSGLDISPVITHRFHYTDFQKAFDIMEKGDCGKVILEWG